MIAEASLRPRGAVDGDAARHLWAIVLAGGEGVRLRALTRLIYGVERPKQYAALLGSRSLLRQTLDRVALLVPPDRTVVVTVRGHARYMQGELTGPRAPRVLIQPEDRGTAAGVLLPAHWIHWRDPEATLIVFPSDHFIQEEAPFMAHVARVAAFVAGRSSWMVLLGARPTEPQTEYGWVEPGEPIEWTAGGPLFRVRRFWEKPSPEAARARLAGGCLWNTFVFTAKAATLIETGRECLPSLHDRLQQIEPFAGTEDEAWAIRQAYSLAPGANFSRSVLEPCPPGLAVSPLPAITWSDCGTAERVVQSLRRAGICPPWLRAFPHPA
jgi:mannose-1-phosphate guanylyltransferase